MRDVMGPRRTSIVTVERIADVPGMCRQRGVACHRQHRFYWRRDRRCQDSWQQGKPLSSKQHLPAATNPRHDFSANNGLKEIAGAGAETAPSAGKQTR